MALALALALAGPVRMKKPVTAARPWKNWNTPTGTVPVIGSTTTARKSRHR